MEIAKKLIKKRQKNVKKKLTKTLKPIKVTKAMKCCSHCIHWIQYTCGKFDVELTAAQTQTGCKSHYKKNKSIYF